MKITVTGGSGRVGKHVLAELMAHGHEVVDISMVPAPEPGITRIAVDMCEFVQVYNALAGCEAVIHLAGFPGPFERQPGHTLSNNTVGGNNVFQAAVRRGIKRIVVASSDSAFGFSFAVKKPLPLYLPLDENHPDQPDDYYALSKIFNENICEMLARRDDTLSIISLRITLVMEPDQYSMRWNKVMRADPEMGSWNLWSYIDGRDVARAFRLAVESGIKGHTKFIIANPQQRCNIPSMELIKKYYPQAELRREFKGYEALESSAKAEALLGFKAEIMWPEN
jgi:nucleoside-diphosphate-sugar epimerase